MNNAKQIHEETLDCLQETAQELVKRDAELSALRERVAALEDSACYIEDCIRENAPKMLDWLNRQETPREVRDAYKDGIYRPAIHAQIVLGSEVRERWNKQREESRARWDAALAPAEEKPAALCCSITATASSDEKCVLCDGCGVAFASIAEWEEHLIAREPAKDAPPAPDVVIRDATIISDTRSGAAITCSSGTVKIENCTFVDASDPAAVAFAAALGYGPQFGPMKDAPPAPACATCEVLVRSIAEVAAEYIDYKRGGYDVLASERDDELRDLARQYLESEEA